MNIFDKAVPQIATAQYTLTEGEYKDGVITLKALTPLGHQTLKDSPLTGRLLDLGKAPQDNTEQLRYLDAMSHEAMVQLLLDQATQLVLACAIEPKISGMPTEFIPQPVAGKTRVISIDHISQNDLWAMKQVIDELSGVSDAEDTFPDTAQSDNSDAGESGTGSETEPQASDSHG